VILRTGDAGPLVGAVQQMLVEAGYEVSASDLAASRFGVATYTALRAFQAAHVDPLTSHALSEDGLCGPATLRALERPGVVGGYTSPGWRCELSHIVGERARVLDAAIVELKRPTCEDPDGSNRSRWVDRYGGQGQPWCAFFVSFCFAHAEPPPFPTMGSALKLADWGRRVKCTVPASAFPEPADIFIILRADGHGHTGIVSHVFPDGSFASIEGNASNAVRGLIRQRSGVSLVIRPLA
jgi:hypothetical protein